MTGGSERSFLLVFPAERGIIGKQNTGRTAEMMAGLLFLIVKIDKDYYKIILLSYVEIEVIY